MSDKIVCPFSDFVQRREGSVSIGAHKVI